MPTATVADTMSPTSSADPPTADATDPDFVPDAETMSPTMDSSAETASPTIGDFIVDQPTAETVEPSPDLGLEEPTSEPEESSVEPTATPTPTVASGGRRKLQDNETTEATFGPTTEEPPVTFEPTSETVRRQRTNTFLKIYWLTTHVDGIHSAHTSCIFHFFDNQSLPIHLPMSLKMLV